MKKDFSKYFPMLLVVFALEFALVMSLHANNPSVQTDDCNNLPDDGKGLAACAAAGTETQGHDHSTHANDYEPTQNLNAMALQACTGGLAGGTYPCQNVDLLAFMPLSSIGGGQGNDIWGWTDPQTGKEYALMGRTSGTAFVDISDPVNPLYLGNLPTQTNNSAWRDIKVYQNHAYIVADSAGAHGMQVFDLTQLRNVASPPVTFANTAHYSGFGSAHNIVINESSGFAYAVGISSGGTGCSGGLHMVNIQNPTSPVFVGCYSSDGYTHDAQCVAYNGPDVQHQGQEICFNSNEDTLTIVNVTSKASPQQISRTGYTGSEYTHQGWLTEDQQYFILDDELDEQRNGHFTHSYIWDVSDLDSPAVIGTYTSNNPAIDHNMYVKGSHAYQTNYRSGLRILDIANIGSGSMTEVAYFDVYPASNSANFNGSWSNYPYFDSGVVVVSGIEQGLFVLQPNLGGPVATSTPMPTPTNTPVPPTATNTPPPGSTMHVGDLDGSSTISGSRWDAHAIVTIHNGNDNPLANATVNGSWSNGGGSGNCVTNGSGQCTITTSNLKNNISQITFTVNNVTHASNSYQSSANHDPDGDSNGSSIVVLRDSSPLPTATPTGTPASGSVIHVGDLDGSSTASSGNRWNASVLITVHNAGENPVANATVSGDWSAGTNGSGSCVTNASGQCTITKNNIKNATTVTFTVTDITAVGSSYNSGANHDSDGDSNGIVIIVAEP